jgi:hypothetical protein
MEEWNDRKSKIPSLAGFIPKEISLLMNIFSFVVNMDFMNNPLFHFLRTHYSIIPVFQHSNWGEVPKFTDSFEER